MKLQYIVLSFLGFGFFNSNAHPFSAPKSFKLDSVIRAEVDPVVLSLDSMAYTMFTREKFFVSNSELQKSISLSPDQLPHYSPEEMKYRLKMIPSAVPLDYNKDVQAFIDLFVYRRRELITKMLASSQIYFPLFEGILDRKKMPDELKYLPIVESALNPTAVSSAGAAGLWQLMHGTGKMLGCDANSYIDERRDPIKSTEAGTAYLKQLYDLYGDWQLALASYNSGPGYVNKAIARTGVKNFWAIKDNLPSETRSYVPTYIAVVYAMFYANDYKLYSAEPKRELYAVDTIVIPGKVSLKHISNTIGIPLDELQFLNPSLKTGIIPLVQNGFPLNLPVNYFAIFETKKATIMNDPEVALQESMAEMYAHPQIIKVPSFVYYKVGKRDNINLIAKRYGVSTGEIKSWNHLKGNNVSRGQSIKIQVMKTMKVYRNSNDPSYSSNPSSEGVSTRDENIPLAQTFPIDGSAPSSNTSNEGEQTSDGKVLYYYQEGDENKKINPDETETEITETTPQIISTNATIQPEERVISKTTKQIHKGKNSPPVKKQVVQYYKVRHGETLSSIASKFKGMTVAKIKSANGIRGNTVTKGQSLKIVF